MRQLSAIAVLAVCACIRSGFENYSERTDGGADAALPPLLAIDDLEVDEGTLAEIAVRLDRPADRALAVHWIAVDGTAVAPADYGRASGTEQVAAGANAAVIRIGAVADAVAEPTEQFTVALVDASGARIGTSAVATVRIRNRGGAAGVVQVAAGDLFSCALSSSGAVKCWGVDSRGQLGQHGITVGDEPGEMGAALPAIDLGSGLRAQALARGGGHLCALLEGGRVKCWGSGGPELGVGDREERGDNLGELGDALPAIDLGTGRTALQVAAGWGFSCVLLDNGQVKCWGGFPCALGLEGPGDVGDAPGELGDNLPAVNLGTGRTATAIAAGPVRACAVLDNGWLKCWGGNNWGDLGYGDLLARGCAPGEMGDHLPPIDLGTGRTARQISLGEEFSCALLDDDSIKCWGANWGGVLGQGDNVFRGAAPGEMGDALPPIDLGAGRTAQAVVAGDSHACALLDDASVKCWGSNYDGQLGIGDDQDRGSSPGQMGDALPTVDLGLNRTARELSLSVDISCALLDDTALRCFGSGRHGALGLGHLDDLGDEPGEMGDSLPALDLGPGRSARALATGYGTSYPDDSFSCAIVDDGSVRCWGSGNGPLGRGGQNTGDEPGELGSALAPIDLGAGQAASALCAGSYWTCALLASGQVKCWGGNFATLGQGHGNDVGNNPGELGDSLLPVDLGSGHSALAIACDYTGDVCALLDDRSVKCWGRVGYTLGLGGSDARGGLPEDMGDNLPPVDLGTGRKALQLAGGGDHFCALLDDATVKCWGGNVEGQLGQGHKDTIGDGPGEMGDALPAIELGAGAVPVDIVAGWNCSCALFADGRAKCWGSGALGNGVAGSVGGGPGEMGEALPFVAEVTLTKIFAQSTASLVCGLRQDGGLVCWGDNSHGQAGQGHTSTLGDAPTSTPATLPAIALGNGHRAVQVATGASHTCALLDDATIKCFGDGRHGELGYGDSESRGDQPGELGDRLPAVEVGF